MSARGLRYLHQKSGADEFHLAIFIVIGTSIYLIIGDNARFVANSILAATAILLTYVFPEEKPPYENLLFYWCMFAVATLFFDPEPERMGSYYLWKMLLLILLIVFPTGDNENAIISHVMEDEKKNREKTQKESKTNPVKSSEKDFAKSFKKEPEPTKDTEKSRSPTKKSQAAQISRQPQVAPVNESFKSLAQQSQTITVKEFETNAKKEPAATPNREATATIGKKESKTTKKEPEATIAKEANAAESEKEPRITSLTWVPAAVGPPVTPLKKSGPPLTKESGITKVQKHPLVKKPQTVSATAGKPKVILKKEPETVQAEKFPSVPATEQQTDSVRQFQARPVKESEIIVPPTEKLLASHIQEFKTYPSKQPQDTSLEAPPLEIPEMVPFPPMQPHSNVKDMLQIFSKQKSPQILSTASTTDPDRNSPTLEPAEEAIAVAEQVSHAKKPVSTPNDESRTSLVKFTDSQTAQPRTEGSSVSLSEKRVHSPQDIKWSVVGKTTVTRKYSRFS